jgi:hypothetical protein
VPLAACLTAIDLLRTAEGAYDPSVRRLALLWTAVSLLVAACAPQAGHGREVTSRSGQSSTCLSEDQAGLISCHEALRLTAEYSGTPEDRGASRVEARLDMYTRHPSSKPVRAWVITYQRVSQPMSGPSPASGPRCVVGDWDIVIDATTGEHLVEGGTGTATPCP